MGLWLRKAAGKEGKGETSEIGSAITYMKCVARRAIDDRAVRDVLSIVNHDGPDVDEHEQRHVGELLQREQEREDVVRHRLRESVERVERVGSVGRRHDPLVVRLMQRLIDRRVVQPAMDKVDPEVGEDEEEGDLEEVVPCAGALGGAIVELGVASHFS